MGKHSYIGVFFALLVGIPFLLQIPNAVFFVKQIYWGIDYQFEQNEVDSSSGFHTVFDCIRDGVQRGSEQCARNLLDFCGLHSLAIDLHGATVYMLDRHTIGNSHYGGIYRLQNGYLTLVTSPKNSNHKPLSYLAPTNQTVEQAAQLVEFQRTLQKYDIPFLYIQAPHNVCKYSPQLPIGVSDATNDTMDEFLEVLYRNGVEVIDCREFFKNCPDKHYESFYVSDTHWNAKYAFLAFTHTAEVLNQKFGFSIAPDIYDIKNYQYCESDTMTRNDLGGNWGRMYPPVKENFFEPQFSTEIEYHFPHAEERFDGEFSPEKLIPLQQYTTQNKQLLGKKILLLGDSFSAVYRPYLSLVARDVFCVLLNPIVFKGEPIENVSWFISEFQPDIVIMCLTGRTFQEYFDYFAYYSQNPENPERFYVTEEEK